MSPFTALKPGEGSLPRLFIFFGAFSILLFASLSPSIYAGDSGILTSAAYFLGTPHPPGYPLYMLLGKAASFLPFGSIAFRLNLLSALLGAITALLTYETACHLTNNRIISTLAPLTTLTSATFVLESSKAEVYTLNALLAVAIFYLCLRTIEDTDFYAGILLSTFLLGLGMGNHHTIGFMAPLLLYTLYVRRRELRSRGTIMALLLFLIGFSVYIYLGIRTYAGSFLNFIRVSTINDFIDIFFRLGYEHASSIATIKEVGSSWTAWLYSLRNIASLLTREILPLSFLLVIIAFLLTMKEKKTLIAFMFVFASWFILARLTLSPVKLTYQRLSDVSPYFLPMVPVIGVIAAYGLNAFFEKSKFIMPLGAKIIVAAILVFQALYIPKAVQSSSLKDYFIAQTWFKDVSRMMSPKGFYFAYGDHPAFLSFYFYGVERLRDDILVLDGYPGSNSYNLNLAPRWKYHDWFPEFYSSPTSPASYFYPFAQEGRLYASSVSQNPENITNKFRGVDHVLIAKLLPPEGTFPEKDMFVEDFQKIDYLPIVLGHKKDKMTRDLNKHYARAIWKYAALRSNENPEEADYFFRLAFFIADEDLKYLIIKDYVSFLAEKKGHAATEAFIVELKHKAEGAWIESVNKIESFYRTVYGQGDKTIPEN